MFCIVFPCVVPRGFLLFCITFFKLLVISPGSQTKISVFFKLQIRGARMLADGLYGISNDFRWYTWISMQTLIPYPSRETTCGTNSKNACVPKHPSSRPVMHMIMNLEPVVNNTCAFHDEMKGLVSLSPTYILILFIYLYSAANYFWKLQPAVWLTYRLFFRTASWSHELAGLATDFSIHAYQSFFSSSAKKDCQQTAFSPYRRSKTHLIKETERTGKSIKYQNARSYFVLSAVVIFLSTAHSLSITEGNFLWREKNSFHSAK